MKLKVFISLIILNAWLTLPLLANKSSVSIDAPSSVRPGEEITIKVNVFHRGNSSFHYTKRVVVLANQKEIARWDFSSNHRPEAENFSREIKLKIETETEIRAEANCNLHGSAGPASVKIKIAE